MKQKSSHKEEPIDDEIQIKVTRLPQKKQPKQGASRNTETLRTESLERILGDKADQYFSQLERTLSMKPRKQLISTVAHS